MTRIASPFALLALAAPATAQVELFRIEGSEPQATLASDLEFVGDVDGDGIDDFAASEPKGGPQHLGQVLLYSGADRSLLRTWSNPVAMYIGFGQALARVGDYDQDGVDDLAITGPGTGQYTGHLWVVSTAQGTTLFELAGSAPGQHFGYSVEGLRDVDGDGVSDIAVGSWRVEGQGRVDVYSGATSALVWSQVGDPTHRPGRVMASLGDVNGDGADDLIVGDFGSSKGRVQVYSGADGALLYEVEKDSDTFLGLSVAGPGDMDGDGVPDWVYGFGEWYDFRTVVLRSGATGAVLHEWTQHVDSDFGRTIEPAGDVNHDGVPDLWVSRTGVFNETRIHWIDGASRGVRAAVPWSKGSVVTFASAGDLNGDGAPDLLVGDPSWHTHRGTFAGFSIGCSADPGTSYCTTSPNSAGSGARMAYHGSTSMWANDLRLAATGCPPGQVGIFFYGAGEANTPLGDGALCIAPPVYRLAPVSTGGGVASHLLDLGALPKAYGEIVAGSQWRFQFWYRDPGFGTYGNNLSDGLLVGFQP